MSVFEEVQNRIVRSTAFASRSVDVLKTRDSNAFAAADVEAFFTQEAQAMRDAGFSAACRREDVGVDNISLEWVPAARGNVVSKATFSLSATGDTQPRFLAHITYLNDEGDEAEAFLSSRVLTAKILAGWFDTFVDLCLTASISLGKALEAKDDN